VSPAGAQGASRVLVVGSDADVSIALHLHLDRAGHAVICLPGPGELDAIVRVVAPHVIVLLLPAAPDATWGTALTTAANAAKVGVRVVMVAPSRDIVEPLAAVAGAEKALARAEVMSRPLIVVERVPGAVIVPPAPPTPGAPARAATLADPGAPPARPRAAAPSVDLLALIDEELVDEPKGRPVPARVEVNVSLVSEHNFYIGTTRRIDSGGVFIATALPPPIGTRVQVRLGLADGRKVDVEGEVAFVREKSAITGRQPSGCGVRLVNIPGWAIEAIERFMQARQPVLHVPQ
jgi:Tfp pilus assembly protein PilZ